jgi:aspartate 4-decarboxylase
MWYFSGCIRVRLAEDHGIVLLNGGGFEAPQWSMRLSLASLPDEAYEVIGRSVRTVARGFRDAFEDSVSNLTGGGPTTG